MGLCFYNLVQLFFEAFMFAMDVSAITRELNAVAVSASTA